MKTKAIVLFTLSLIWFAVAGVGDASAQVFGSRVSSRDFNNLLVRIETKTDTFNRLVAGDLDRSTLNNSNREDRILEFIDAFESATDALRSRFDSRQSVDAEVREVLNRAAVIDAFMRRNELSYQTESQWTSLRADLDTLARYNNTTWNWNQGGTGVDGRAYIATDVQLRNLLSRIEQRTDIFKRQVDRGLDRSRINGTLREDSISAYITEFENATDRLKERFDSRQSTSADVNDVLTRATYIDQFMGRNDLPRAAETQWINLRSDLNTLANYYRVSWNWGQTLPPWTAGGTGYGSDRLTGTYRLNRTQSDDVPTVVNRSIGYYGTADRTRVRANLERRLSSPDMLAIERSGRMVTIGSSLSPQLTLEANGVARTETNDRGRTIRTTATIAGDSLTIAYEGDRANDFYVTFMPIGSNQLRVTRRIYLENRNEQVTVTSVYDRIDNTARWSDVENGRWNNGDTGSTRSNDFYVPNGTRLTAELQERLDSRTAQVGDRIAMRVTSPGQYSGAVIEGRVIESQSSGRVTGRAALSLDLDTIRLSNGQTYRFAGLIDSVRTSNGDTVSVNNEGQIRDNNQTTKTVTRAGIGAALGALIGAIAGGGQGAAIGAAIGAGAGAGTVFIQGRDNIVLEQGTEFNITASAPANVGVNR
ncbi:MAG: hypothetical protein ACK4S4_04995 [Pyrinomonadaceae bacterium]